MLAFILIILLKTIRVYSYLLLIYALLSWFPGAYETGLGRLITQLVEPVIRPFRRLNLQFAGLDFTVLAVMLALNLLSSLLINLFS
ncbi:YggT family protein [Streptococcus caballi]|uniref:YggT family protein n=1 Tax=Streptococcus caballi TaxID=439220 RepID=UPI000478327C|nr:YggT family protein [Streptococcus caballi]